MKEAAMKQFVPLPDDFPLESLDWPGALVPYRCGLPCQRLMDPEARVKPGAMPKTPPRKPRPAMQPAPLLPRASGM
jgi:hypothetical protein